VDVWLVVYDDGWLIEYDGLLWGDDILEIN